MEAKQQFSEDAEGKLAILVRDFSASRYTLDLSACNVGSIWFFKRNRSLSGGNAASIYVNRLLNLSQNSNNKYLSV